MNKQFTLIFTFSVLLINTLWSQETIAIVTVEEEPKTEFSAVAELGFLNVFDHTIQFSKNGTNFNYKTQGGQDVLFPVSRFSMELKHNKLNTFVFLYQPLRLESQVLLTKDLIVDNEVFAANTSVKLLYNFPFYRMSYLRELIKKPGKYQFAIGFSLQIRNATISFESADGSQFRTNRDIGLVPAIKLRGRMNHTSKFFTEIEADGIYAPVSYLNGSDNEVVGAILDASIRSGYNINSNVTAFLNARYLGGGAVGTSDNGNSPGDGYVRNWLNFGNLTLGVRYTF